jgi:hypothetical protein
MTKEEELERIRKEVEKAQYNYHNRYKEWRVFDMALLTLCSQLGNDTMKTVLPKVVAVDRLYKANLIRYLRKPAKGEGDTRFEAYSRLADALIKLDLDSIFAKLWRTYSRLNTHCLAEVVHSHTLVSQAVQSTVGHRGESFASKYLHFCRPDFFPILDTKAEKRAYAILGLSDSDGNVIVDRFGYDEAEDRYDRFCRAVLAIQAALAGAGLGQYSLAEMDRYLYGY